MLLHEVTSILSKITEVRLFALLLDNYLYNDAVLILKAVIMNNLIENLPENINITVTKQDLLEFADYLLSNVVSNKIDIKPSKSIMITDEVAKFVGISKSTIYKYTHEGQIPHYKRGKRQGQRT